MNDPTAVQSIPDAHHPVVSESVLPMAINRHVTNLESRKMLEADRDQAQARVDADRTDPRARAALDTALARLIGHDRTLELIRREFGEITEGPPQGTEYRTAEAIAADGYIGLYSAGAGRG